MKLYLNFGIVGGDSLPPTHSPLLLRKSMEKPNSTLLFQKPAWLTMVSLYSRRKPSQRDSNIGIEVPLTVVQFDTVPIVICGPVILVSGGGHNNGLQ